MSETRCEPPEHLRGVDGWHWVQQGEFPPSLARWHPSDNPDVEPLWTSTEHVYSGTPRYAAREWGLRYLAPVTPPAVVAALVEALEPLAAMAEHFPMVGTYGGRPTSGSIYGVVGQSGEPTEITVEHLHAARAAIAKATTP